MDNSTQVSGQSETNASNQPPNQNIQEEIHIIDPKANETKLAQPTNESSVKKNPVFPKVTPEYIEGVRCKLIELSMKKDPVNGIDINKAQYFESWKKLDRISVGTWDAYDVLLHISR